MQALERENTLENKFWDKTQDLHIAQLHRLEDSACLSSQFVSLPRSGDPLWMAL